MASLIARSCRFERNLGCLASCTILNLVKASMPGPYSAKHLVSLNSKSKEQRNIKRHEQLRRMLIVDIGSDHFSSFSFFFFKYGVVRNWVSSSKSQVYATQSAIDEGREYSATHISRQRRSCHILNLEREHTKDVKECVFLRVRARFTFDVQAAILPYDSIKRFIIAKCFGKRDVWWRRSLKRDFN